MSQVTVQMAGSYQGNDVDGGVKAAGDIDSGSDIAEQSAEKQLEELRRAHAQLQRENQQLRVDVEGANLPATITSLTQRVAALEGGREKPSPRPPPPHSEDLAATVTALENQGMTNAQVQKAHQYFELYDLHQEGSISTDEVYQLLCALGQSFTKEEVQTAVDKVDENQNGDLELNEFLVLYSEMVATQDVATVDGVESRDGVDLLKIADYGVFALMRWVKYEQDERIGGDVTGPLVPKYKAFARALVLRRDLEYFFYSSILMSAVVSATETNDRLANQIWLQVMGTATMIIFALELLLKFVADTGSWKATFSFWSDAWNAFDTCILLSAVLTQILGDGSDGGVTAQAIRILRLLRAVRMFRAAKIVPEMMLVMETLLRSITQAFYIFVFTLLISYVFAIVGVTIFGRNDPFHWGSLSDALLTLFRIATQEDWTDIMYFNIHSCTGWGDYVSVVSVDTKACEPEKFPLIAPIYFIVYMTASNFLLLNLFVGVIVNSMVDTKEEAKARKEEAKAWAVATRLKVKSGNSINRGLRAGMEAAQRGLQAGQDAAQRVHRAGADVIEAATNLSEEAVLRARDTGKGLIGRGQSVDKGAPKGRARGRLKKGRGGEFPRESEFATPVESDFANPLSKYGTEA